MLFSKVYIFIKYKEKKMEALFFLKDFTSLNMIIFKFVIICVSMYLNCLLDNVLNYTVFYFVLSLFTNSHLKTYYTRDSGSPSKMQC